MWDYCIDLTTGLVSETLCKNDSGCADGWEWLGSCEYAAAPPTISACLDSTAINYDSQLMIDFDYCMSPDGFVTQTECTKDGDECTYMVQIMVEITYILVMVIVNILVW